MSIYKKNQSKALPSVESPYKKRLIQIAKMANYEPIASIPNLNNDFNFTYAKDGLLKRKAKPEPELIQSVPYSPFNSEHRNSPNHARLPRIDSKPSKIQYHPTNASEPNDQHLTLDTRLETQEYNLGSSNARSSSPPLLQASKQKNNKKIKNRYKVTKIYSQENSEQEDETEYSSNATPGPGYYSFVDNRSLLNSKKGLTDWSFGSKAERFMHIKPEIIAKSVQKNPEQKQSVRKRADGVKKRKLIPFLSCSFKQQSPTKEKVPGPQDYHPRNGIQEELIRKIQRNFKGNFGVCQERFRSVDQYPNVAPGIYSIEPQNQSSIGSYYFLSQQKRFK